MLQFVAFAKSPRFSEGDNLLSVAFDKITTYERVPKNA
jgi:hypothetical protein